MWIDRERYTSHIDDGEKLIKMRRLLDKIQIVLDNHMVETTDFLDPYERHLAMSILNRFDEIGYTEYGGYEDAERKVIIVFPFYRRGEDVSTGVSALKIEGDLENLSHRDYLGAILNLGIDRNKIGDILVISDYGFVIVKDEISDFIQYNLEKIGNKNVKVYRVSWDELVIPQSEYREITEFLSSLRLDVVISAAYNLSRKDSMNIIKSGNVKVNWGPIDKPSLELKVGDTISVRKYGRFILYDIEGMSKKGRLRSVIRILM
ncbi:RNA-binding protein [Tissierellaceae bacterium HCP3S3_D8]